MKTTVLCVTLLSGVWAGNIFADENVPMIERVKKQGQVIEVCFVLDTTGSMGGLIDGAKKKIWSIANELAKRENIESIRFSLIGYRDLNDEYVTKLHNMTEDLDLIHGKLTEFSANGGGDHPESVNQALHEAVTKVNWSSDQKSKKIIFLVGDAPPHMDYEQDIKYKYSCQMAKNKSIVINTLQCGADSQCKNHWLSIAQHGGGKYVALPQDGGTVEVSAPQDTKIAELTVKIYNSAITYGDITAQKEGEWKRGNSIKMAKEQTSANATKNAYQNINSSTGSVRAFSGSNDLISEWSEGRVNAKNLNRSHLPDDMKKLNNEELSKEVKSRIALRNQVQQEINMLQKEREEFLKEAKKKENKGSFEKSFDKEVESILDLQLKR